MPTTDNTSVVGSALTANWADLNKGVTGQMAEQTKLGLDQPLQAAIEAESQSYADQFAAARDNTTTAYMIRGYLDDADKLFPRIDAEFNAASGVEATIKAFQLDRSDDTLGALGAANSAEHQQYIAQQLREKADRERLLANATGTSFLWETLDPAWLLASWATFGGSTILKLGKAGRATLGAAGGTVPLALADQAGKDVSTFDYVLNAAMFAGVTAIWGGAANMPKPKLPGAPDTAGFTNFANDFLSETDKIANVNDLTRDLMRNFVDDPVRRGGLMSNDNAVSFHRLFGNRADGLMYSWQQTMERELAASTGLGFIGRKFDLTGKFGKARDELEDQIAVELARRDFEFNQTGSVTPSPDARIGRLADQYEDMMGQGAEMARDAGLPGFKDFQRRPGYFHRAWNENKMRAIEVEHGREFTRDLLTRSVMSGLGLEKAEAGTIATAILTRMDAKQRGLRADFMGALGAADSDGIAVMLKDAGVDEGTIKSVMGRIDQNLSERGRIKYGKERLPLDMTLTAVAPNGKVVRMLDMIDTDLSRVAENYMQAMTGRSALARAGYGGDDASINDFKELQRLALEGRSEEYYRKLAEFKQNVKERFENAGQVETQPKGTVSESAEEIATGGPRGNLPAIPTELTPDEQIISEALRKSDNPEDLLAVLSKDVGTIYTKTYAKRLADVFKLWREQGHDLLVRAVTAGDVPEVFLRPGTGGAAATRVKGGVVESMVMLRGANVPGRRGINPVTALHELTHSVTVTMMDRIHQLPLNAKTAKVHASVAELQKLHKALATQLEKNPDSSLAQLAKTTNIMKDPKELVAWAMSDSRAQDALRKIRLPGREKTALSAFVDNIKSLFGLTDRAMPDDSVLSIIMQNTDNMLDYVPRKGDFTSGAPATVARSDAALNTFRTQSDIQSRMKQLDYLLGDFTGIRPEDAILGPYAQRAKSFAQATMLAASGLWQIAETATIAWRFGAAQAGAEFVKQFPGIAGVLRKIGRDPDLYDELGTVLGMDLARDVRVRPWLRQFEPNLAVQGDHTIDRVLHYGQQAVPILNGMKFVHQWQTRVSSNLAMNTLVRASNGDAAALKLVQEYGLKGADWDRVQTAVQANVRMNGKNARAMNWDAWAQQDVESAMNVVMRIMDDSVLFGRAGQGSSFSRSGVGQVLGQFRSFVAFAHNKLLRGTIQNQGYTGLAMMLAHQYPLTVIMVAANEFRKGEEVSFDEEGLADLMQKAVGYTAGLGFIGDAAGIVGLSGGRGGISVPITGLANAAPAAAGAVGNALQGEGAAAAGDAVQTARTVLPFISIMPGVAALQNALKE